MISAFHFLKLSKEFLQIYLPTFLLTTMTLLCRSYLSDCIIFTYASPQLTPVKSQDLWCESSSPLTSYTSTETWATGIEYNSDTKYPKWNTKKRQILRLGKKLQSRFSEFSIWAISCSWYWIFTTFMLKMELIKILLTSQWCHKSLNC